MTKNQAQELLTIWQASEQAITASGTYTIDDQILGLNDLPKVQSEIDRFTQLIAAFDQLTAWEGASLKLATAQIYSFRTPSGERTVHRADSESVLNQIKYWKTKIKALDPTTPVNSNPLSYSLASFE